jgi:hypothetical protein
VKATWTVTKVVPPFGFTTDSSIKGERYISFVWEPVIEFAPCYIKTRGTGVVYNKDLAFVEFDKRILNPDRLVASQRLLVEED